MNWTRQLFQDDSTSVLVILKFSRIISHPVPGNANLPILHDRVVMRDTYSGLVKRDTEPPVLLCQSLTTADHLLRRHSLIFADLQQLQSRHTLLYTLCLLLQATERHKRDTHTRNRNFFFTLKQSKCI